VSRFSLFGEEEGGESLEEHRKIESEEKGKPGLVGSVPGSPGKPPRQREPPQ
jgi:hypothetical protein